MQARSDMQASQGEQQIVTHPLVIPYGQDKGLGEVAIAGTLQGNGDIRPLSSTTTCCWKWAGPHAHDRACVRAGERGR
jgi:hypothetical protein